MKIRVFQSEKGDCLLVTTNDKKRIMIDGGMRRSYMEHVARYIAGKEIDLLCVSHIDQDHIQGVLEMMNNITKWRVYKYQKAIGNNYYKKPKLPAPPIVRQVWHNAFNSVVSENDGSIEDLLAASSAVISQMDFDFSAHILSKKEAIQLSNKLNPKQLNIPLNEDFGGKLVYYKQSNSNIKIGDAKLAIVGPFKEDLDKLREDWNEWLQNNPKVIAKLKEDAEKEAERLGHSDDLNIALKRLGNRKSVTVPNLASIMFLLEEDGKTALFTGDGHSKDILKGLKKQKKLDANESIHVNVLKIQHHGSEHNLDKYFCKSVTADHYIFCGNGAHENPDLDVMKVLINSRLGKPEELSKNKQVSNKFKIWFNSSETNTSYKNKEHMEHLEKYVSKRAAESNKQMRCHFMATNKHSFEFSV